MERAGILIDKLHDQFSKQADINTMIVTAQMLYTELLQQKQIANNNNDPFVAVSVPNHPPLLTDEQQTDQEITSEQPILLEEPVTATDVEPVEVLEVEVAKPAPQETAELTAQIKDDVASNFVYNDTPHVGPTPFWNYDPVDIPTLAHQSKIIYHLKEDDTDDGSLNNKLKEQRIEVASVLQEAPIRDLKKAISINDRHNFIESLFRGDETMYERSIKTINNFSIYAEAEFWIQRELKLKLGWDSNQPEVKLFDQLVKRRFA